MSGPPAWISRTSYSSRPSPSIGFGSGMVVCDGSNGKCRPSTPGGGTRNSSVAWIISRHARLAVGHAAGTCIAFGRYTQSPAR